MRLGQVSANVAGRIDGLRHSGRALNPYARHVPILVSLARLLRIRSVLEFGSGRFSTIAFLDRSVFPQLEILHSVEDDAAWRNEVLNLAGGDPRLYLELVETPHEAAVQVSPEKYDLILIDDSRSKEYRVKTIECIVGKKPQHAVLVIHDFEIPDYQSASRVHGFRAFHFRALLPETGVVYADSRLDSRVLRSLERSIRRWTPRIDPGDHKRWARLIGDDGQPKS